MAMEFSGAMLLLKIRGMAKAISEVRGHKAWDHPAPSQRVGTPRPSLWQALEPASSTSPPAAGAASSCRGSSAAGEGRGVRGAAGGRMEDNDRQAAVVLSTFSKEI